MSDSHKLQEDPPEGSRKVIEKELERQPGPESGNGGKDSGEPGSDAARAGRRTNLAGAGRTWPAAAHAQLTARDHRARRKLVQGRPCSAKRPGPCVW
jgi:hypothetical protein